MKFKFPSQIKTKALSLSIKNKKWSSIEGDLRENSTRRNLLRFEYEFDQISQTGVKNRTIDRKRRVYKTSRIDRNGRVGDADMIEKVRRQRNRSITTNKNRVEEVRIAKIDK